MNEIQHLTICLIEELSEVQKALTKSLRFGYDDIYEGMTNLEYVQNEFVDVSQIVDRLDLLGIDIEPVEDVIYNEEKLNHWLKYSQDKGLLDMEGDD